MLKRWAFRVTGTVQGVGFRPFVARLAQRLLLTGFVANDATGVVGEVQGDGAAIAKFKRALTDRPPPLAHVESVTGHEAAVVEGDPPFFIGQSSGHDQQTSTAIPADVAPCGECRREVADRANRRYGYAFTCCVDCGPRYTVIEGVPYDRSQTTMAPFLMCEACRSEHDDPGDRRYHAQAVCCPACGPQLDASIVDVARWLTEGQIGAIKGLGGYQLVCRADDEAVVAELRRRKRRDARPFALLVNSVEAARKLVALDGPALSALASPAAPIVLASRLASAPVARNVAPDTELLGVMLPATPAHQMLSDAMGGVPLVCTSGNYSGEPIVIDDELAQEHLDAIADFRLGHNRRIARRADDSVGHVSGGEFQLLRRARGFAPAPLALAHDGPTVLAVGAELKNTVCLAQGRRAHLSVHLGDLEHPASVEAFEEAVADLIDFNGAQVDLVAHDLHPEYVSTKFATSAALAPTVAVQHHHAHLAACLAENSREGDAIGVTFDGFGWGLDGTSWGGEFLCGDASGFTRGAHLATAPLIGGSRAVVEPWRMAVSYLHEAELLARIGEIPATRSVVATASASVGQLVDQLAADRRHGRDLVTSAVGRLFDAVAVLCGVGDDISYEAQAAIRLEQLAGERAGERAGGPSARYEVQLIGDDPIVVDYVGLMDAITDDLVRGIEPAAVAGAFHRWVCDTVVLVAKRLAAQHDTDTVALTGGVFQNRLLSETSASTLSEAGFVVLQHRRVPPNDGGISLGQAVVARARKQREGGLPSYDAAP